MCISKKRFLSACFQLFLVALICMSYRIFTHFGAMDVNFSRKGAINCLLNFLLDYFWASVGISSAVVVVVVVLMLVTCLVGVDLLTLLY